MVVIVRQLDLQLPMQSVSITTNVVSSNPDQARCTRYNIAADRWFSLGTPVSSTNNTNRIDITEILLKVALNTITLTPNHSIMILFLLLEETYIRDVHKLDRSTSKYGDILNKCIRQRKRSTKCNVLRIHIISKNIGGQAFFSFFRYYIVCHLIYGF